MNKVQFDYDVDVQFVNRESYIRKLANSIDKLKCIRKEIHLAGQIDKKLHKRRVTLVDYHQKIDEYEEKIANKQELLELLKSKNGYSWKKEIKPEIKDIKEVSSPRKEVISPRKNAKLEIKPDNKPAIKLDAKLDRHCCF